MQPKLIIHGGAGGALQHPEAANTIRQALRAIVQQTYARLQAGDAASVVACYGARQLESHPLFNAGYGSVLQTDGQIRMSAALMNGSTQTFSGIINVSKVEHPIDMAAGLQTETDRVLSDHGATERARELQLPLFDPITDLRLQEWLSARQGNFSSTSATVVAEAMEQPEPEQPVKPLNDNARRGTVGIVVRDQQGCIATATSTGGKGLERIGRVSDSAMPAGTYATAVAGVSCTGIGEDIIDQCLAARLVVRVTDGLTLAAALNKSFSEGAEQQRDFGAIAIDHTGTIGWGKTSDVLLAAYHTGEHIGDTLALPLGLQTGCVNV
ncbi:MAG: isoaspartyl peptidase/L-asparaginase [Cyanobacteria bacterium J06632_22]